MSTPIGILISGRGSNMVALVEAMLSAPGPAEPAIVVSNDPAAPGLARAEALGVPTAAVDHRAHSERAEFEDRLTAVLRGAGVELVACAGFMRILTGRFVDAWAGRLLNIHPSLLPLFPGLDTHARAIAAGVAIHGCTVHEVTAALDAGRILGQAAVPVRPNDTEDALAERVLAMEHRLYPAVLSAFAADPEAARAQRISMFWPPHAPPASA